MKLVWRYFISLLFLIQIYVFMAILGILFFPYALITKKGALRACKIYARYTIWCARWMVGIDSEVRGTIPTGEVVVAAKHQSFFDIILIFDALPQPKFIMKKELLWTPFIGLYAKRLGCIPVDRGKRGATIAKMVKDVAKEFEEPGQLVIYPQGTRVIPGAHSPTRWALRCCMRALAACVTRWRAMSVCSGRARASYASLARRWWNFWIRCLQVSARKNSCNSWKSRSKAGPTL